MRRAGVVSPSARRHLSVNGKDGMAAQQDKRAHSDDSKVRPGKGNAAADEYQQALNEVNAAVAGRTHARRGAVEPRLAWRLAVWVVLGATVLGIDQVTKALVRAAVLSGWISTTVIPGVLDFTFVMNFGAAFGIGQGFGAASVLIAAVVVAASAAYLIRAPYLSKLECVGLGLVLGGAVGNAIDRIVHGFVTDFIATTFIDFPVFNVADIGIVVGVVLAFAGFAFFSPATKMEREAAEKRRAAANGSAPTSKR